MRATILTIDERQMLDELARTSRFWHDVCEGWDRQPGHLRDRLREALAARAQRSWRSVAKRIDGVPVRNAEQTPEGLPQCAWRRKPWCSQAATEVVEIYGFCAKHASEMRREMSKWERKCREIEAALAQA